MKTQRLSKGARSCDGLRPKGQGMEKSGLNNRLETRAGKGTLNAGRTLWLAENKGLRKLTQIKFVLRPKCLTKIRYLAARPLNLDEIKGEIVQGTRLEGGVPESRRLSGVLRSIPRQPRHGEDEKPPSSGRLRQSPSPLGSAACYCRAKAGAIKMLKMKDDPAICMKTNVKRQNDWRENGQNCITEQKFDDIFDVLRANRDRWTPVFGRLRSLRRVRKVSYL